MTNIIQFPIPIPMTNGNLPQFKFAVFGDDLATITTAGYLNSAAMQSGLPLSNADVIQCLYSYNLQTGSGTYGVFTVSIAASNGQITLSEWTGTSGVVLPTVANYIAHFTNTTGTLSSAAGNVIQPGNISAGLAAGGTAGTLASFPATGSKGALILAGVANTGNTNTTISNAAMGQASVVSIPDPGAATAKFLLDTGTGATATITKISTGATPVPLVDPGSCTITAAAGAANTATVTIQLKDGSGTNIARSIYFKVYASSAADGLTLASAASTGFSVASGGLSLANGSAITTEISAMSSATGGCVLSLLDTAKQTSYLVLVLPSGNKISAQLTSGSYG